MTKFNYYKLSKAKKIRYLKLYQKNRDYIVFLHGFMSNLEGKKPKTFLNFAKKNNLGFLALEYSGHGKSSGKFTSGNISKWTKETNHLIKKIRILVSLVHLEILPLVNLPDDFPWPEYSNPRKPIFFLLQ